jgi:Domain of unknown function (DUF4351)
MTDRTDAVKLILRLLTRRFGDITPEMQLKINALSIYQLEDLGEALLAFSEPADLANWLLENGDEINASLESKFLR